MLISGQLTNVEEHRGLNFFYDVSTFSHLCVNGGKFKITCIFQDDRSSLSSAWPVHNITRNDTELVFLGVLTHLKPLCGDVSLNQVPLLWIG